jgi:hypothetical protein
LVTVVGGALISSAVRRKTSGELLGLAPTYLIDAGANLGVLAGLAASRR